MKTENRHRLAAVFIVLAMLLTLVPFEMFVRTTAKADGNNTKTLDLAAIYANEAANVEFSAALAINSDFTVYPKSGGSSKIEINQTKSFSDGYSGTVRVNWGGGSTVDTSGDGNHKGVLEFTTTSTADVKVWWAAGDAGRQVVIRDSTNGQVATTNETLAKNDACISTLKVTKGGTYYLGNSTSHNYIYKVEITEGGSTAPSTSKEYTLDLVAIYANEAANVEFSAALAINSDFTVYPKSGGSSKIEINQTKSFSDGYSGTVRVNWGGGSTVDTSGDGNHKGVLEFTTTSAADVKVWWAAGDAGRQVVIRDSTNGQVATTNETLAKNDACISTLKVTKGGTYYLGNSTSHNYIYKVVVTETAGGSTPVVRGDWTSVTPPSITNIAQTEGKAEIKVTVSADISNDGGDEVAVTMYDKDNNPTTKKSIAEKTEHELVFNPTASGNYTFKAELSRTGETSKKESDTSSAFTFSLPLGKPTSPSATSKGNGSIEVKWGAVTEATGYKVYLNGEANKTVTGNDTTSTTITGLTVGTTYKVTVAAVRDSEEGSKSVEVEVDVTNEAATEPFVFETKNMPAKAEGSIAVGTSEQAGTDNFFTVYYNNAKAKYDGSSKTWDDGYSSDQRLSFNGSAGKDTNAIKFTTTEAATVKVWWVAGANGTDRQITILDSDGRAVETTSGSWTQNSPYMSTFKLSEAGTYYVGSSGGNNYLFKVQVKYGTVIQHDWGTVAAPVINSATADNTEGTITVNVSAAVGERDADSVTIIMYDATGAEAGSAASAAMDTTHNVKLTPKASGTYTFKAVLSRSGATDKTSGAPSHSTPFTLPLKAPSITSLTNVGGGRVAAEWTAVTEATGYKIYVGGTEVGTSTTTTFTTETALPLGSASFKVAAVRNAETGPQSDAETVTVIEQAQNKWSKIYYGTSTSSSKNTVSGNINEGSVTVSATGNAGKIILGSGEGVTYYYTAIPTDMNFTLRAKIHLDNWTYNNGQEGFGLIALDRLPENPNDTEVHWSNQYMLAVQKVEYRWDSTENDFADPDNADYPKYSMSLGIGATIKTGITPENLAAVKAGTNTALTNAVAPKVYYPMEHSATAQAPGNYNIIGGLTDPIPADKNIAALGAGLTDFDLEIRKNNTGYFLTYYSADGTPTTQKFYEPGELSVLDTENVYVGFFAARNAVITIDKSDFDLEIIDPAEDDPAEERPIKLVKPTMSITSASVSNTQNYNIMLNSNVNGTVTISSNYKPVATNIPITAGTMLTQEIGLIPGTNNITAVLTPAPDEGQNFPPYTAIANTDPVTASVNVSYTIKYAKLEKIYVSPEGTSSGMGNALSPLDIYTAVKVARPGQTIVIMEGTYNLASPVRIERGIDGTADEPIRMIADPEAATRPVFDFTGSSEGIRLGGNYWYMYGFDVTNSGGTGMRVCGNYNTVELVDLYANGNTGLQISAFRDSNDPVEMRPKFNTILNCTAFNNADPTGEDADGFAAKLTVGEGNVFDGCASYNNTDDGWDLYARVSSGAIGAVTIRNCVAYNNGHNIAGTISGNGNGFKLGGENLPAGHTLINCFTFNNDADGITSNSCPDVKVINCTSYNNKKTDLNLYTNNTGNTTNFTVQGVVVGSGGYTIKKNTTDTSQVAEGAVKTATASDFESTTFGGLVRKDSGAIDLGNFLKLKDSTNGGATFDKTSSSLTPSTPVAPVVPDTSSPSTSTTDSGDKTVEFEDKNNNTDITVNAPDNAFDNVEEVKFNADPVIEETTDEQFTFDLFFTDKDGNKVQPKTAVTVKVPVPTVLKDKTIFVYHVEDNGKYTEIDCKVESGMIVFTATSFSKYIITSTKLAAATTDSSDTTSGGNTSNTSGGSSNPSTGAAIPMTRFVVFLAGAAALCVFKRKRG